jgi:cyclic lactone autoinducer peptide
MEKEKNTMKNLYAKYASVIAALALMVTVFSINRNCMFFAYQPELPEGAEKLRRL